MRDLEREVGRALDALPAPRAPRTLVPRVLRAADAMADAMPGRRAWPPLAQAALVALALLVVGAVVWGWPASVPLAAWLPEPVQDAGRRADLVASTASDLVHVGSLVWQAVVAPIVKGLFAITAILCALGALFAAALGRLALGGAHQS